MQLRTPPMPLESEQSPELVRLLRDQIADLEAQLARTERLATLGSMSGAIAHEFNNILTPLLSYAGLALSNLHNPDLVRKALEKSIQSAERAGQVADALLGSVRAGEKSDASCGVRDTIHAALSSLVRPPMTDGIEVLIDVPSDLRVAMTPGALHQVLLNLILNSCDAMRPGPGTLAFSATRSVLPEIGIFREKSNIDRTNQLRSMVLLRVVDTGPGMSVELASRVFDPLFSTKTPTGQKQQGGSGFGLTVCRRLVQQVGGDITLRSEAGIGTSFALRLPESTPSGGRLAA